MAQTNMSIRFSIAASCLLLEAQLRDFKSNDVQAADASAIAALREARTALTNKLDGLI